MQAVICRDEDAVHFGQSPRLGALAAAYTRSAAESWVEIQLADLSEYAGCKEKLSSRQLTQMSQMILNEYSHYNMAELMLFFQRFKLCRYGRFYGAVDPMVIFGALKTFDRERLEAFRREEQRRLESEQERLARDHHALRERYQRRVPGAFTPQAPLTLLQYTLLGYDSMPDEELAAECTLISNGAKALPQSSRGIFELIARMRDA